MTFVYYAVEGETDVPVAEELIRHVGLVPWRAVVARGTPKLDPRIRQLGRSALNWLVLRDLDRASCAPDLIRSLLPQGRVTRLAVRIAVREVESWLMADADSFSSVFGVRRSRLPAQPDDVEDPKRLVVDLCRRSTRRAIAKAMVPRPKSGRVVGPEYVGRMVGYGRNDWSIERAARRSPSLARAIATLERLVADGSWA